MTVFHCGDFFWLLEKGFHHFLKYERKIFSFALIVMFNLLLGLSRELIEQSAELSLQQSVDRNETVKVLNTFGIQYFWFDKESHPIGQAYLGSFDWLET